VVVTEAISWGEFVEREPELAQFGVSRLLSAPSYLATVRESGAPRVHPVTVIFTDLGMYLFMEPTSPKGQDLRERGWFALHNGVPDEAGSGGEFHVIGHGLPIDHGETWSEVAEAASYVPADRYVLFELQVSEALCKAYGDVALPSTRKWSVIG
jgi:hypothetical protein